MTETVNSSTQGRVAPRVRFGCSSFSSEDWVGPFYAEGTNPARFLESYAEHFDTVEIDATYYAIPRASVVEGWRDRTPDNFLVSAKFPHSIVHGGKAATPDPKKVLVPESTFADRDRFLDVMSRLGDKLGTLVLQFPYFSKNVFDSPKVFFDRLEEFLVDLPPHFDYAVEVRNRTWVTPELAHLLRRYNVGLVLVDQAWMPHGDELIDQFDPITNSQCYIRLLGDHKEIEAITQTWDVEVMDRRERLKRWARLLQKLGERGVSSLVYVNNHYAGHAPTTVRRLVELYQKAGEASA